MFRTSRSWQPRSVTLTVLAAVLALASCGGGAASPGGSAGTGLHSDAAGAAGASGDAAPGAPDGASNDGVGGGDAAMAVTAPGRYVTSAQTSGAGSCVGTSLGDVLAQIRAATPALADIQTIYNPANGAGGGSFVYPYARSDGGFDVVFQRGLGDCPAGCTENDYQYFSTDASCHAVNVGHYHTAWGAGSCLMVDGAPMWNHPPPPDPLTICGQENVPQDLGGTYQLHATGQRTPCVTAAVAAAATVKTGPIDATVTLVIVQDAKDLSTGTVTFSGTGHALVDGVPLPARFQRRRFDAALQSTNSSASCPRDNSVTGRYDFEGYQPGGIEVTQLGDESCAACKGSMSLTLSAP